MAAVMEVGAERRTAQRKVLRGVAYVLAPGAKPFEVRTLDISESGLSVFSSVNPPAQKTFTFRVSIPILGGTFTAFEVRAQVVHSVYSGEKGGGFKVGLRFVNVPEPMVRAIADYLD